MNPKDELNLACIVEDINICPHCNQPMEPDGWHFCAVSPYPLKEKLEEKFDQRPAVTKTTRLDTSA